MGSLASPDTKAKGSDTFFTILLPKRQDSWKDFDITYGQETYGEIRPKHATGFSSIILKFFNTYILILSILQ